jgi:hypothetical protein
MYKHATEAADQMTISPFAFAPAPTHRQPANDPVPDSDNPQSAIQNPQSTAPTGRPRALDNAKRSEIIELVSGGFDLESAARVVRCSVRTIRRAMKRDPHFAREVRRSEIFSLQNPLGALQHALHRNWRTAAWLLERLFPERFAHRPQTTAFGKCQARQLLNEVLRIVDAEVIDLPQRDCIHGRIRATFEYFTHVYCEPKRTKANLRQAIALFEKKDNGRDLEWLASHYKAASSPIGDPTVAKEPSPDAAAAQSQPTSPFSPKTIGEAFQDLIDDLKTGKKAPRSKGAQNATRPNKIPSPIMSAGAFGKDKMDKTIPPSCAETSQIHKRAQQHCDKPTEFCPQNQIFNFNRNDTAHRGPQPQSI